MLLALCALANLMLARAFSLVRTTKWCVIPSGITSTMTNPNGAKTVRVFVLVRVRKRCATRSVASTMNAGHRFILGSAYILSPGIEPVRDQWREDRDEPCISPGFNN